MLTALVDGTVPPEGRRTAERHALGCPACLRLLEDAESTDFMLRLAARAEPAELSADFADRVVAATRAAGAERDAPSPRQARGAWREGVAWFAAAASLVLAVVFWSSGERRATWGQLGGASVVPIASPVFSGVRDATDDDRRRASDRRLNEARLDALAPLVDSIADAIDAIATADASNEEEITAIAARVRAEELSARTALLRISMPPENRAALQAAEAAFLGVTSGCLDAVRLEELQSTIRTLDLAQRLRDLVRTLPKLLVSA